MKKLLESKALALAAGIVMLVGLGGWFWWSQLGGAEWFTLNKAVGRIEAGRQVAEMRQVLLDLNDRRAVLDEIEDRLAAAGGTVQGRVNLLQTLAPSWFNQPRSIRRAIESEAPATRRAAAWLLYNDAAFRSRCGEIALDWLRDAGADARGRAVLIARQLELDEVVPILLEVIERDPETQDDLELMRQGLAALRDFKPAGLTDRLLALAENTANHETVRAEALETLSVLEDAPHDKVRGMAIATLQDASNTVYLRSKATNVLQRRRYADETSWSALEKVLLDPDDSDRITQRNCLKTLGTSAPLDRLRRLVLDRRVYDHPYFAIRTDVATALCSLGVRERVTLDILTMYLTDDDPKDLDHVVRREAWLSLWTLTGVAYGVPEKDLFKAPPPTLRDPADKRQYLWATAFIRPGVNDEQVKALGKILDDDAKMRQVQETYQNPTLVENTLARWEEQETREAAPTNGGDEPAGPVGPVGPVGPTPPEDGNGGGDEDADDAQAPDDGGDEKTPGEDEGAGAGGDDPGSPR